MNQTNWKKLPSSSVTSIKLALWQQSFFLWEQNRMSTNGDGMPSRALASFGWPTYMVQTRCVRPSWRAGVCPAWGSCRVPDLPDGGSVPSMGLHAVYQTFLKGRSVPSVALHAFMLCFFPRRLHAVHPVSSCCRSSWHRGKHTGKDILRKVHGWRRRTVKIKVSFSYSSFCES